MRNTRLRKNERGTSMAEFAVVALFFFMMIFGVIEFGRFLYVHNALADAARRGARYAVLHQAEVLQDGTPREAKCVKNVVMYGESHIRSYDDGCDPLPGEPVLINNIGSATILVEFHGVDLDGNPLSRNPYGSNLGTATVTITNYTFQINIPLFRRGIAMPTYSTTLPAESAGYPPDDI